VILAALPALLLTVYSTIERRASTESQARAELKRLVKLAAMQQWQVVEGARQMMVASSQTLFTLLNDPQRCTEYFASLLAQNRETYHSMGLFRPGKITASLGIALFPDHGEDTDALLRVSDMALYAAKGAGRNRVVVGSAEKR